ncbi:MAG: alpha-L-fucosidase [Chitinophagaceae bacterium]|nr:alpha-L-fucosidase [Chitinophagaceae bacterium]
MKKHILLALCLHACSVYLYAQTIQPYLPVPTKQQLDWHGLEFYFFVHFGPNTFTDKEWGHGDEPEDIFNPTGLDCRQWARTAKQSGAKGIIITAKHHDGFCLWPSKYSKHTVRESKWKKGKGDVLRELSQACKEYGIKFGVYISPWDRNHPQYGTPEYNDVFVNMMKEIFSNYGPIWELWWDGANGEGPNGKKQVYDWGRFESVVRQISPNTVVFSDIGPDIRWVGNEKGIAGKTNWNGLDTAGFTRGLGAPHTDTLNKGNIHGKTWIPAECDVSIRPGWFYHAEEDGKVKTPEQLFNLYLKSVGRGANFLLNIPPDRRGLIHANDSVALVGFRSIMEKNFANNLVMNTSAQLTAGNQVLNTTQLTDQSVKTYVQLNHYQEQGIRLVFTKPTEINCIVLQEAIEFGQRIQNFEIDLENSESLTLIKGTTVGRKRIVSFPTRKVNNIVVRITQARAAPILNEITAHKMAEILVEENPPE